MIERQGGKIGEGEGKRYMEQEIIEPSTSSNILVVASSRSGGTKQTELL